MLERIRSRSIACWVGLRAVGHSEDGQALVEYALIISLIAIVAIGALQLMGTNITALLNTVAADL